MAAAPKCKSICIKERVPSMTLKPLACYNKEAIYDNFFFSQIYLHRLKVMNLKHLLTISFLSALGMKKYLLNAFLFQFKLFLAR